LHKKQIRLYQPSEVRTAHHNHKELKQMPEQTEVIVRANSTIKLKMPSGMTADWTYIKGTPAKQMISEIAESLGYQLTPIEKKD
jgi:hypothetical protein